MLKAIYIKTKMFDPSLEEENPINPIYGSTLISWLAKNLKEYEIEEPFAEDWGWCSYLYYKGRSYLIGSMVYFEAGDDPSEELEWVFQVEKHRTLKEKLLGREKMDESDPCFNFFLEYFRNTPEFTSVEVG